jgi:hypothetical protein
MMQFIFTPKSHYPIGLLHESVHDGINTMTGKFAIEPTAWYDCNVKGHYINKIVGFTLDRRITINSSGIWNHRDSLRVGWKPSKRVGYADILLYLHYNGRPLIWNGKKPLQPHPKDMFVCECRMGDEHSFILKRAGDISSVPRLTVNGSSNNPFYLQENDISFPLSTAGYILAPYHGGNPKPYNTYNVSLQVDY